MVKEKKTLEVNVEKGSPEGHRIVLKGASDECVRVHHNHHSLFYAFSQAKKLVISYA
jgi:DnaJ-class molecular chaperone